MSQHKGNIPFLVYQESAAASVMEIMNIRTAHANAFHFDQDLIRCGRFHFKLGLHAPGHLRVANDLIHIGLVHHHHFVDLRHKGAFIDVFFLHYSVILS